jgi:hypothetical protein
MYYLVRYEKPAKHVVGAKNKVIGRSKPYKTLLEAERQFLKDCINLKREDDTGFRIDNAKYNDQIEFWNMTNGLIYVKTEKRNAIGKKMYKTYTLPAYRDWLNQKAKNPFSAVI